MEANTLDRFQTKYCAEEVSGCWTWLRCSSNGYGQFRIGDRMLLAHRAAYEHYVGPIADGLQLDHLCRNRRCVNPAHLEPVTPGENVRRGDLFNGSGLCRACGEPYDRATTDKVTGRPHRRCRPCNTNRARSYREARERAA